MRSLIRPASVALLVLLCWTGCTQPKGREVAFPMPPGADRETVERRIRAYSPKSSVEFTPDGCVRVEIYSAEDSLSLSRLTSIPGEVYIAETYEISDLYEQLFRANQLLKVQSSKPGDDPLLSLLRLSQGMDGDWLPPGPVAGYVREEDMARGDSIFALPAVQSVFPRDLLLLWSDAPIREGGESTGVIELIAVKKGMRLPLDEKTVREAHADKGYGGFPMVSITLDKSSVEPWRRMTGNNVGRCLAIVIDGRVRSWPRVNQQIEGGRASISGDLDMHAARELSAIICGGPLFRK